MVYNKHSVESETMLQMVPSAGYTPPCDYSAFAADSFDLSLLPGGETDLPLSPSTQLYTQSPPPNGVVEKPKIYTSYYPNSPEEAFHANDIELGPDFQKLLAPEEKKDTFTIPKSPNHLDVNSIHPESPVSSLPSYCSTPDHQLYQQSLISPQYPSSPAESFNLYPKSPAEYPQMNNSLPVFGNLYGNSTANRIVKKEPSKTVFSNSTDVYPQFQIKEENFLSPCSQANSPSSCTNYSNISSPIDRTVYLPKTDNAINNQILNEVLLENNFLNKQIKQESTVDFGELLHNLNSFKDILDNDYKKPEPPKQEPCKPKEQDHQLLRQVLKDTSFQRKYNLKPFDFGLATGFVGSTIKMEEPEQSGEELMACNEELAREKIEPVLSLAIEQMRKDVKTTCSALGIAQDPSQWNAEKVKAWLQWTVQQFNLASLQPEMFEMTGAELAALSEEEFTRRAPQSGSILHAQLEIWKAACMDEDLGMQWTCSSNQSSNASSGDMSDDDDEESTTAQTASTSKPATTRASGGGSHIHLWQFLKELLASPQVHGSCIRWLDRGKGVFKIEDSVRVAKLWGKRKNRPAMNYDKLSRSIRQYYKKGIMKKTEKSQRLVYQFCHPYSL